MTCQKDFMRAFPFYKVATFARFLTKGKMTKACSACRFV